MLILSRKVGEKIHFGRHITIIPVEIRGDKVRLGIDADREWPVHRGEVLELIAANGETLVDPLDKAKAEIAELLGQVAKQQEIIKRLRTEMELTQ